MVKSMVREKILILLMDFNKMDEEKRMLELIECIPQLKSMYHYDHNQPAHCYDVFKHTLSVVDKMPDNETSKVVALLHDIGKPYSAVKTDDGVSHYWGHPMLSYAMAYNILTELNYEEELSRKIANMCLYHDSYLDRSYEEFIEIAKVIGFDNVKTLMALQKADLYSHAEWYYKKHEEGLLKSHENVNAFMIRAKEEGLY